MHVYAHSWLLHTMMKEKTTFNHNTLIYSLTNLYIPITLLYWQVLSAMINAIVHVFTKYLVILVNFPRRELSTINVLATETHNKHIDRVTSR